MELLRVERLPDLRRTLAHHVIGNDPTARLTANEFWRATLTPAGAVTLHLRWSADRFDSEAWGPGRDWALERVNDLIGLTDSRHCFPDSSAAALLDAQRRHPHLRLSHGHSLYHSLLPVVIGQRVTAVEAHRSWR